MYYKGIPEQVLEQTKRTKHQWGFMKKLNEKEIFDLATAKDSVGVATRKKDLLQSSSTAKKQASSEPETTASSHRHHHKQDDDSGDERRTSHKRRSHRDADASDEEERHRHASSGRHERKKHRKHHESVLEELVPKETGREAMLEKRRQVASKLHGAARDRDANRDGLDLSEEFLMGGGAGTDLQRRLKQREVARDRKQQEQQEKLATFEVRLRLFHG